MSRVLRREKKHNKPSLSSFSFSQRRETKPSIKTLGWLFFLGIFLPSALLFGALWNSLSTQHELESKEKRTERLRGCRQLQQEVRRFIERHQKTDLPGTLFFKGLESGLWFGEDGTLLPFEASGDREQWEGDNLLLELPEYFDGLREEQRGNFATAVLRFRLALKKSQAPHPSTSWPLWAKTWIQLAQVRVMLRAGQKENALQILDTIGDAGLNPEAAWTKAYLRLKLIQAQRPGELGKARNDLKKQLRRQKSKLNLLRYWDLQEATEARDQPSQALRLYRFLASNRGQWLRNPSACLIWDHATGEAALALLGPPQPNNNIRRGVPLRPMRFFRRKRILEKAWEKTVLAAGYDWSLEHKEWQKGAIHPSLNRSSTLLKLTPLKLDLRIKDRTPLPETFLETQKGKVLFLLFLLIQGCLGMVLWATLRAIAKERRLTQMRSDFVSSVSHELKTPLTAIKLYSDLLLSDHSDPSKRALYPLRIREETQKLSDLVGRVLDTARIEAGCKLRMEPVDLEVLLRNCAKDFEIRIQKGGVHLEILRSDANNFLKAAEISNSSLPRSTFTLGDSEALGRVLANLLENSLKHGGNKIRLALRPIPGWVELTIHDNGPGVSSDKKDRLFLPFERGVSHGPGQAPGTGLGLALIKKIVEAHEAASVQILDAPEGGFCVLLRFPSIYPPSQHKGPST